MDVQELHRWDVTPSQARRLQDELAPRVQIEPLPPDVCVVAGADLSVSRQTGLFFAAVVVVSLPGLETVEVATAYAPARFPYVPGLLTFREGPALVAAFRRLRCEPDVVMLDGQGLAHPRRFGLACHIGLWLGVPAVGCAKSRLIGTHEQPGLEKGEHAPLMVGEEQVGVVLRTRSRVRPVFVSPGYLADCESSWRLVLRCCGGYRIPEPTRRADKIVAQIKKEHESGVA